MRRTTPGPKSITRAHFDQLSLHLGHHLLRIGFGLPPARTQHEAERRNLLHHAVVQLAGDPRALLRREKRRMRRATREGVGRQNRVGRLPTANSRRL
jgi:hypothetical protein